MARTTDCIKCGKVHAWWGDGTVMGPDDGVAHRLDPSAWRLQLMPESYNRSAARHGTQEVVLCDVCVQPLLVLLKTHGILK